MKKYFFKTISIFLAVIIFPMVGGFCFQDSSFSMLKTKVTNAAISTNEMSGERVSQFDICADEIGNFSNTTDHFNYQAPKASNHDSILPCCVDSKHSDQSILSQSVNFNNLVSSIALTSEQLLLKNLKIFINYNQTISSPRLSMVKTIVLRL